MKISIVTATWQRPEVFELFAKGVKALPYDLNVCVSGSEGNVSKERVEKHGFKYIEYPNHPLASKMNAALSLAKGSDYVICVGSDDIIHPDLFAYYLKQMQKGFDFIGALDWYFYDTVSLQSIYWGGYLEPYRKGATCGAGRVLSKAFIDSCNWSVWEDSHSKVLDNSMDAKLKTGKYKTHTFSLKENGLFGLDIKSSTNMTPFEVWNNSEYIDSNIIKTKFDYLWS